MNFLYDMIYFHTLHKESIGVTSGIMFTEFLEAIEDKPRNILILTDDYTGIKHDEHTCCAYLNYKDAVSHFSKEHFKVDADFIWVEFDKQESLKTLTPQEVAELYYVRKQWNPMNDYYFQKLNNKYFYLSHDDAHMCQIWYKDINDFYAMLGRAVSDRISLMYDVVIEAFDVAFAKSINDLNDWGVYLNFKNISTDKDNGILIPVYCMEKDPYIDSMYDKVDRGLTKAAYYLKYYHTWEIIKIYNTN